MMRPICITAQTYSYCSTTGRVASKRKVEDTSSGLADKYHVLDYGVGSCAERGIVR